MQNNTSRAVYEGRITMVGDLLSFDGKPIDPQKLRREARKHD